jgi:hypothetical protein
MRNRLEGQFRGLREGIFTRHDHASNGEMSGDAKESGKARLMVTCGQTIRLPRTPAQHVAKKKL